MKTTTKLPKKRPQWLPVVAGVIRRDASVLLGRRPEKKNLPGKWEFPGGKIEAGESPEAALRRELKEELDIEAEIGDLILAATHVYGDVGVVLLFYEVKFWTGQPSAVHHSEIQWVENEMLPEMDIPDANRNALDRIIKFLK